MLSIPVQMPHCEYHCVRPSKMVPFITMTPKWARWRLKSPRLHCLLNCWFGWPANSPHKRPVTRKMFPFDDVIMFILEWSSYIFCRNTAKCVTSNNHKQLRWPVTIPQQLLRLCVLGINKESFFSLLHKFIISSDIVSFIRILVFMTSCEACMF